MNNALRKSVANQLQGGTHVSPLQTLRTQLLRYLAAPPPTAAGGGAAAAAPPASGGGHIFVRGARIGYCRIHLFAAHFVPLITG
jgi:hypothetical protein